MNTSLSNAHILYRTRTQLTDRLYTVRTLTVSTPRLLQLNIQQNVKSCNGLSVKATYNHALLQGCMLILCMFPMQHFTRVHKNLPCYSIHFQLLIKSAHQASTFS